MRRKSTLFAALILVAALAAACGGGPAPTTTLGNGLLTQQNAIDQAVEQLKHAAPEVTGVENPRNPVAWRMTLGEYDRRIGASGASERADTPVWVIQIEGESTSAGIVPPEARKTYRYAVAVLDARTGNTIATQRSNEPLAWPTVTDAPSMAAPGRFAQQTPEPAATSSVLPAENPCIYAAPDPTPVPPGQAPTLAPTSIATPAGTPTPSREIPVPPYPSLPIASPEAVPWLAAVVTVNLTFTDRSPYAAQGLVVDPNGLVMTSFSPEFNVASIRVTIRGEAHPAEMLRYDPRTNVALLQVDARGLVAAPHASVDAQTGQPAFAIVRNEVEGSLTWTPVFVSPSVNAPQDLAALLSLRSRTVKAGVVVTGRDGRLIGITQPAGWQWTGTSIHTGGPIPGPDQPIVLLDSALAVLGGARRGAEAIPAAVAYHGQGWGSLADGPATRDLVAGDVQKLIGQVGEPVRLEGLGQRARNILGILGSKQGTYLELLYAQPQTLRAPDGKVMGQARYIVLWWRRDAGQPDLLLCGMAADRLGVAFAMPLLGHLEQVMEKAPRSSRSVVLAEPLPVADQDVRSYPYSWTFATDRQAFAVGEPVRFTLTVTNISRFPMSLDFTQPMVRIRGINPSWDVALLPHGDGHRILAPAETVTFEVTWDGRTAWGEQARAGEFYAQALMANEWSVFGLGATGPSAHFVLRQE